VELRGKLVAVHADLTHTEHSLFYLKTGNRYLRLKFRHAPAIRPRSPIRVVGRRVGTTVRVSRVSRVSRASASRAVAAVATTGTQRLLAILTRWDDRTLQTTRDAAASVLFGADERSTDRWYQTASYGQLGWTGDVTPVLTIAAPTYCDLYGIAANAKAAAVAAGYDPDAYDHVMFVFPRGACGADGYGEVGGRLSWIIDGIASLDNGPHRYVADHELGHNLGRWHSHGLECGSVTISRDCLSTAASNNEYGNLFDVMGNNNIGYLSGAVGTFSAKPLIELGWFTGRSRMVTQTGSYDIAPLELQSSSVPQALVIESPGHIYYVEFRRALGLDSYLAGLPDATQGVHVNMSDDLPFGDNGPLLLDTTPGSIGDDFRDASLAPGATFDDVRGAFRLSVESVAPNAARVNVEFGDFAPPETTITSGPSGAHGSTMATFTFDADEPGVNFECRIDEEAWSPCASPATVSGLSEGYHVFAVRGRDAAGHLDPTEATQRFFVDVTAPRTVLTAPAGGATVRGSITLRATAEDNLSGVVRVKWFLDQVQVATDGGGAPWERAWNSASVPNGVHKLVAKARDDAGNWGASRSILITTAN
jgi:hypothetical protein